MHFGLIERLKNIRWFSSSLGAMIFEMMNKTTQGLSTLSRNKGFGKILITSIALWGLYYIETIILVRSCNLNLESERFSILYCLYNKSLNNNLFSFW